MPNTEEATAWRGRTMVDGSGDKLGKIDEIYVDAQTDKPEWALVTTGLFGSRSTFVPLAEAGEGDGDDIRVPYAKAQVKDAPNIESDHELSQDEEANLYRHYGIEYGEGRSDTGLPEGQADRGEQVGRDTSGPSTDDAMTRSEEELSVGTRNTEVGRARLKKHVVTEMVTKTVPVQREEVRIEREPITDANAGDAHDGPAISEEEHEVTLHAEEPVVEKNVVAKERVRLEKDTVTDEHEVSEEVRKERIEHEGGRDRG
ncbi:MAG: DUF2382 domain-containing protein [Solirubrobacteraceae bacterium]